MNYNNDLSMSKYHRYMDQELMEMLFDNSSLFFLNDDVHKGNLKIKKNYLESFPFFFLIISSVKISLDNFVSVSILK